MPRRILLLSLAALTATVGILSSRPVRSALQTAPPRPEETTSPFANSYVPNFYEWSKRPEGKAAQMAPKNSSLYWMEQGRVLMEKQEYDGAAKAFGEAERLLAAHRKAARPVGELTQGETPGPPEASEGTGFSADDLIPLARTQRERCTTVAHLYVHQKTDPQTVRRYYTGARLEPVYGAYLGVNIDQEPEVRGDFTGANGRQYGDPAKFTPLAGRHALYFNYWQYGGDFPSEWFEHLKQNDAAGQWVIEPKPLSAVREDAYLIRLAKAAGATGAPIFVRFAGEMNGDWTHRDYNCTFTGAAATEADRQRHAKFYIEKFRLVARIFHQYAPNVAMVWCPNHTPERWIDIYYPGPDAVDWVGVNVYTAPFIDGKSGQRAAWANFADRVQYVYDHYSARHPIMIGECGASHESVADKSQLYNDFAIERMGQLYAALPRIYPRVKAVNWFSLNARKYARPGRQLNNFSLLDQKVVHDKYMRLTLANYFLRECRVNEHETAPLQIEPLRPGARLSGRKPLSLWVRAPIARPTVRYYVRGQLKKTYEREEPGEYVYVLDTREYPSGPADIRVVVSDERGRTLTETSVPVVFANGG